MSLRPCLCLGLGLAKPGVPERQQDRVAKGKDAGSIALQANDANAAMRAGLGVGMVTDWCLWLGLGLGLGFCLCLCLRLRPCLCPCLRFGLFLWL